jgi:tetratricopeptide (TPR) repeat protein
MLSYDLLATGNLERAEQIGELWAQTYPRDAVPHAFLAWINQLLGRYEKAMEEGKNAIDRDPDFVPAYNNLAWSYVFLNRFGDAEKTIQRASDRKLETPDLLIIEYYISFLRDDKVGMERATFLGKEKSGMEDWISHEQALVLAYSGHLQQATRMSRSAVNLAQQASQPQRAALYQAGAALLSAFFGKASEAKRSAIAALEISKARDVEYGAAFALALSGDTSRSQALANDLEKRFPEDTFVRFNYLPTLRAFFALNHSEPSKAIELLQTTARYELATPGYWFGFLGNFYPTYVRGAAYLAKRQPAEAAAEFQKILDHPGIVLEDPMGAFARLQLARAWAMAGDVAKAKAAYAELLRLWTDADPAVAIVSDARAEYARLP